MARLRRHFDQWSEVLGLPESPALRVVAIVVIALVPGAGFAWVAWRMVRGVGART
jgi:hypothetical protein